MRGLIWNCEGLGMSGKFDFLKKLSGARIWTLLVCRKPIKRFSIIIG
jgi:hypothetical protein